MLVLDACRSAVTALAFSPAGELAVADRHAVSLWPPGVTKPRLTIDHPDTTRLAFTPDGRYLVGGGAGVVAWRTDTAAPKPLADEATAFTVAPDGKVAVCTRSLRQDPRHRRVFYEVRHLHWHALAGGKTKTWPQADERPPHALAFDPLGRLVFVNLSGLEVWDVALRTPLYPRVGIPWGDGKTMAFAAAGDRAASTAGAYLRLYKLPKYTAVAEVYTRRARFTGLALHPSGWFLAVTDNAPEVRVYDAVTLTPLHTLAWSVGKLQSIAFSPDGLLAAAGTDTGQVVVWDADP